MEKLINDLGFTRKQLRQFLISKRKPKSKVLMRYFSENKLNFGIVSDTHLCSTHEKLSELHTHYAICKKQGVKIVFHAGDLVAGWGMYHGQPNEVKVFGATSQAKYVIDNYPKVDGIVTYFITGNHDLSWWKESGVDIGVLVAEKRPDMIYLGQCFGEVKINNAKFRLLHPDGGSAYAISYKGQKIVESLASGTKPDVLIIGHYHTANYFYHRLVHVLNAGCFEGQTLYLIRKNLNPAVGGYICEIRFGKKDRVVAFQPTFIPYF